MKRLDFEIKKSKYMLTLEDNFNDEGDNSADYLSWRKSINLVEYLAGFGLKKCNVIIDIPKISGSSISIDLFWKTNNYKVLLCYKDQEIVWYGKDKDGSEVSSDDNLNFTDLVYWLINQLNDTIS